jgi:hypothetical protein
MGISDRARTQTMVNTTIASIQKDDEFQSTRPY